MKQGTVFLKLIFAVVFLALLAYLVFAAVTAMRSSITTTTALAYEVGDGLSTTGFVVRDEQVLRSSYEINVLTCAEGEKVSAGSEVAVAYQDNDALALQAQIDELDEQLAQLQYVYDAGQATNTDTGSIDRTILNQLVQCAIYTTRGSVGSVMELSTELKSEVLRRYLDEQDFSGLSGQIAELNRQRNALKQELSNGNSVITASSSGYFSGTVDGYEALLSSSVLQTMGVEEFDALMQRQVSPDENAIGKLIYSPIWYYVTSADAEQAAMYKQGQVLHVTFAYDLYDTMDMRLIRISDESDGRRLLVLSSEDYLSEATGLRMQSADIVAHTYAGLRVPKQAIYYSDEGKSAGVYILEGNNAVWKDVELLFEVGEYYIVKEDKSSVHNLWPGDEIIVTDQELFDGKVVS